ncbi:MAG: phosphotransferase [Boseongicola sp.]|nr:MAG: phosphotransferase [Boseongicola sp.]
MPDRTALISQFLAHAGWSDAAQAPVAGDLSSRQYFRLSQNGNSSILMDAPPDKEQSTPAFLKMAHWLAETHLSSPEIIADDASNGLLLLEDFGDNKLSDIVRSAPHLQQDHYEIALQALLRIRNKPAPDLPRPNAVDLTQATKLFDDWYPQVGSQSLQPFRDILCAKLTVLLANPPTVSLRDFHADNIIWLPDRTGPKKLGLLDFQDAILTHPAYDLMSLLTDARVDVPKPVRDTLTQSYAALTGDNHSKLAEAVAILGAQRNLRILGIFARAARRDGKTAHLSAIPRVLGYLKDCAAHPAFGQSGQHLIDNIPNPDLLMEFQT